MSSIEILLSIVSACITIKNSKGQKTNIQIIETSYAVNMRYSELIYLLSNSLDNLVKLDLFNGIRVIGF